ncbi:MAG: hypothetical protein QNJ63_10000 [Calothrix sp. MO_192.B10]|nr:hypothetical protein [Calothrix sp. MO_192.B10]
MTYIPVPQRTGNQKVVGGFYPLQKSELMALRKSKLINNAAYVHLALRYENPFCDRPIEIVPKEFSLRWLIPESSVYEALGKLRKLEIINIKTGKVVVQWVSSQQTELIDCQQAVDSDNPELITESQNELRDFRTDSGTSETQDSKPLPLEDSGSLQTLQNIQTNQTGAVEKIEEEATPAEPTPQVKQQNQESSPTDVTTSGSSFTHISNTLPSPQKPQQGRTSAPTEKDSQIPQDLRNKLEGLEIPLDGRVRKAIASHHISQAYGAVAHIERTWETINNPRGVFLFQISRQPVEPMGARLPVKTAADDLTLEYLKRMYPNNWQDAAAHFGLEVDA